MFKTLDGQYLEFVVKVGGNLSVISSQLVLLPSTVVRWILAAVVVCVSFAPLAAQDVRPVDRAEKLKQQRDSIISKAMLQFRYLIQFSLSPFH